MQNHPNAPRTLAASTTSYARRFAALCLMGLTILLADIASAQQTTSSIRGTVRAPDGTPAVNATVTITDTRTGGSRSTTTGDNGRFTAGGLRVGGPYSVAVQSDTYGNKTVSDIFLDLGDTYTFDVALGADVREEVVVTASALQSAEVALGPATTFNLADLETAPAINRDIKDLIRIDPRVYIDEAFVDAVQCAGANPRFNSLTVDGVRLNDNFGLNSNGYPTERIPFSYDAIQQVAVELAPFDVQYGGFTACNINGVTKSGENQFFGSLFFDYTSDSLQGDELEGDSIDLGDFDEKRYGFTIGGPILRDKLFFFASYEKLEGAEIFDRGPAGSGRGREVAGVSQAQLDEIISIAQNIYGYDPGGLPASLPEEDEKFLVKLDWEINDDHRAAFTYNYNDGFSISQADGDNDELELSNHYYERGAELDSYVAQLFSDWSSNFSTEFRVGYTELANRQISLAGVDFGEVQITTLNDPDGDGVNSRATVYLGADDSRHANKLAYDSLNIKIAGSYFLGEHKITAGFERDEFDVFNLFIQEAEGEYRFSSVDDFRNGTPNRITYENAAPSNMIDDAAAMFGYEINTVYVQDEFTLLDNALTLTAGLRYDWYSSDDVPNANPNVQARYGFSNQQNFDGEGLVQPRFGFNWDLSDDVSLRGGIGIYSGGNPNVWLSNNYSNDGITQVEVQDRSLDDGTGETLFTIPFNGSGRPIFDIPQELFDAVAFGTADSGVNILDPEFEIPEALKVALGGTVYFDLPGRWGTDYRFDADFLYSKSDNSAIVVDAALEQVGVAPDGRPVYRGIDRSDPDCVNPLSSDCSGRSQDFMLTNVKGSDAEQTVFSFALSKNYDDLGLNWSLGYAYTDADEVSPMTSSVAFSNFANIAVSDPNNPGIATSAYEISDRFTLRVNYEHAFFGDYLTRLTVFGSANQGRPFTTTFTNGFSFGDSIGFFDRQLLYVPTGPSDPLVVFGEDFNQQAFFDFVERSGLDRYAGDIVPRNAFKSDWWTKFDVRIEQEIPGFRSEDRASAFLVIENFGNLINDDWGVLKEAGFPYYQSGVDASVNGDGQYVFNEFFEPAGQGRVTDASLWEVRLGVKYRF